MTGAWLATYVALWGVVAVLCLLTVGLMRQLGLIHRELGARRAESPPQTAIPAPEDDGPALGSPILELHDVPVIKFGAADDTVAGETDGELIVFMSPMCEICHRIVDA